MVGDPHPSSFVLLAQFVRASFWTNELLFPAYLAVALFLLQSIVEVTHLQWLRSLFGFQGLSTVPPPATATQRHGFMNNVKQRVKAQGILTTVCKCFSLLGTLILVGLTTVGMLNIDHDAKANSSTPVWGLDKSCDPYGDHGRSIETIYLAVYSYGSVLAVFALVTNGRWSSIARTHLTLVMLTVMAVYVYRDLLPLTTFNLRPKDEGQGWLLWSRLGFVSLVAVFIPLVTPCTYTPVDSLNPAKEVPPEQTASWFSFLTHSYMDPLIIEAARTAHLPYDSLPPLADYDRAEYLVSQSEQLLNPYIHKKRRHLFWGLLRFYAWDYVRLAAMLMIKCSSAFMAPFALKMLLSYLDDGEQDGTVQPWVWISFLFIGPNLGSVAMQYYIFLATRLLVRTEGILTQLVFDHALRIRMKEEAKPTSTSTTAANTPDTRSIVDGDIEAASSTSGGETLQGNGDTSSVSPTVAKGKRKAGDTQTSTQPGGTDPENETKAANLIGKINNFVSTDLGNITDGRDFLFILLYIPMSIAICIWFLYSLLGWSALVGMGVMVVTLPLPGYVARLINNIQTERMKKTDARVQTVTETLSVIRMIKLFGWEEKVNEQISEKREAELGLLKKRQLLNLVNLNLNFFFPLLTMLVTFACYTVVQKQAMTASTVFSSIAVFDQLRDSLHGTFFLIPMMINAKVSLGRINDFLLNTELLDRFTRRDDNKEPVPNPAEAIEPGTVGFRNATFSWNGEQEQVDASFRRQYRLSIEGELFFKREGLNLVIGPTGSGKTSLLMALLGEMHFEPNDGNAGFLLPREGGVAYVAQEAWVQNETIKENILFGKPYDKERYDKVIYQCGLERDLDLFEAGDDTEVGEKGLTLSGGQKARVTLARAVYSDAAIVLLDDVLAALDVHTARFIVDNCLQGDLLRGRTLILVTHNVAMVAPIADYVVSLDLDGRIAKQGTVSEVVAQSELLEREITEVLEPSEKNEESNGDLELEQKDKTAAAKLIMAEEIALGHVGLSAFKLYVSSLGGVIFWVVVLGGFFLSDLSQSLSTWFMGYWASQYTGRPAWDVPVYSYLAGYCLITFSVLFAWSTSMSTFVYGSVRAARTIHKKLITSILGTTLRWLDTVPTARIIARCTQDIRAVDGTINQYLGDVIELTIALVIKFAAVILFVPPFVVPGILVAVVGGICGQLYIKAQLSVKREMSNCRSPVLAHFGAAIAGLTSIRAYGAEAAFKSKSLKRINNYIRPARSYYNCNRWVCIRIEAIGGAFAAGLAGYLVYGKRLENASNAGFSLTMAVAFSGMILWWVRILNEFEVEANSLERIEAYVNIEQEPKPTERGKPPAYWPASGSLVVENLRARYSADGPEVLHGISFEVKSGERIGVVGRTGSGKSSLTLSLLRCIRTEGRVLFDGLATESMNLDALRSSITIIPQQPELMSGTLRENLDPFSEHLDATLNDALRATGLFNLQGENDASKITLDSFISSGGGNLSMGQRQILALARAIIRGSKLLILDEATSAIDYSTDSIIQTTLRGVLQGATMITIAHRLQTVMDADKIMVLDAGNMVEFGSPADLLKKNDGYLKSLVDESGDRETLYRMATKAGRSEG